jgi:hypothetical protein
VIFLSGITCKTSEKRDQLGSGEQTITTFVESSLTAGDPEGIPDKGGPLQFARAVRAGIRAYARELEPWNSLSGTNLLQSYILIKRFAISDKAVAKIGEMIHDADLDDARFQRVECVGTDRVLKGWAKEGLPDEEILRHGFECFDALYVFLQRR